MICVCRDGRSPSSVGGRETPERGTETSRAGRLRETGARHKETARTGKRTHISGRTTEVGYGPVGLVHRQEVGGFRELFWVKFGERAEVRISNGSLEGLHIQISLIGAPCIVSILS